MKNELKSKSAEKRKAEYSKLILNEPEDITNSLKQEVLKAAVRKARGESLSIGNKKDQEIDVEASKIVKIAKEYPEDQVGYEAICQDLVKMKQYSDVKMVMFEMEISGSSSEELEPTFQPADDVVLIAAGVPKTVEFYLAGKITSPDNVRVEPAIKVIQNFKGAATPEIELAQILGRFKIYKLRVSSLVRKFSVVAEHNNIELSTM